MNRRILYLALCLLLLLPPTLSAAQVPAGSAPPPWEQPAPAGATALLWHIQGVDMTRLFSNMGPRSLALDASGHPHIAYGENHLFYARYDGSAWQIETVDSVGDVGAYTSLARDADGRPRISYHDNTNDDLKYAWKWASHHLYLSVVLRNHP